MVYYSDMIILEVSNHMNKINTANSFSGKNPPPPPPLDKQRLLKHPFPARKFKSLLLILVLSAVFVPLLISCPDAGGSPIKIVTQELPRSDAEYDTTGLRSDDYRTNIVLFSIKAENTDNANEYRLAIRAASENTPGAEDIRSSSATIVRTVSPTSINVHMGFHMDTTLFDDNTVWDDVSDADQHILNDAKINEAHLQPNTAYTLYGVLENGGTEVLTLLSFNTDAHPEDDITSDAFLYNFPPDEYTFTIRSGEPFLLDGTFVNVLLSVRFKELGTTLTLMSNLHDSNGLPPISEGKNLGIMYFNTKIKFSGEKSRFSALIKNTDLKLNSGERSTIELVYKGAITSTMNFIAE